LTEVDGQANLWDKWADAYDEWAGHLHGEEPANFLYEYAGEADALELGVGTGLVAVELARKGVRVVGVDISERMLKQLSGKVADLPIRGIRSDMSKLEELRHGGKFHLIYSVNSSLFCLLTQEEQLQCFSNAASLLTGSGVMVVHSVSPSPRFTLSPRRQLTPVALLQDGVQMSMTDADTATQRISYRELIIRESGITVLPVEVRYIWPSEMDLMARIAGLRLEARYGDWERGKHRSSSPMVVSVYARAV
jgi:SAM-dependent methyltransferase